MDDHKYFGEFENNPSHFKYFGLLLAVFTWIIMALSAITVSHPHVTATLLAVAFALMTIWITVHLIEIAAESKKGITQRLIAALRHQWIIINCMYIISLLLYSAGASIMIAIWGKNLEISKWVFITVMIAITVYDTIISQPHK